MSNSRFVHLHVHTEFSLADSTIRVPAKPDQADPKKAKQANLLSRSVELGLPALAVTDLNNLFARSSSTRPPKAWASSRSPVPTC